MGRGGGKTTFFAGIGNETLTGELYKPGAETVIVASSFDQAIICFRHLRSFFEQRIPDEELGDWSINDSSTRAQIRHKPTNTVVKVRGSDPNRAHGLAPSLVLADEPARWEPNKSREMLAALETGMGKQGDEKMIALGTRPAEASHWFAEWLDGEADTRIFYAADPNDDPFSWKTVHKANPSLKYMPALRKKIEREMRQAKRSADALQTFKALRLNMGTADVHQSVLLEAEEWKRLRTNKPQMHGPVIWGVDMGGTAAMSAISAYWPETGWLDFMAAFPDYLTLRERGNRDGVGNDYVEMAKEGDLITTPGRTVDPDVLVGEALDRFGAPIAVAADRWREGEILDALERAGVPPGMWSPRGMGYKDGGEDVRRFRRACADGRVRTRRSRMMETAMAGAVVMTDPAGNAKLAKHGDGSGRNARHRDDAVAAAILAVAEGERGRDEFLEHAGDYVVLRQHEPPA